MDSNTKLKAAYVIVERGDKSYWTKIGVAFRIRATSNPSAFGSATSMTTASGRRDIRRSRTSSPERASTALHPAMTM